MELLIIALALISIFVLVYGNTRLLNLSKNTVYNENKYIQGLYKRFNVLNTETDILITIFEFLIAAVVAEVSLSWLETLLLIIFKGSVSFIVAKYISILLITVIATYFTMIAGVYIPKHLVHIRKKHKFNDNWILYLYGAVTYIFYPITFLSIHLDTIVREKVETDYNSDVEEVKEFTTKGVEKGVITKVEKEIIERVVSDLDKPVSKICTKIENVISIKVTDEIDNIIRKFAKHGISRVLVYDKKECIGFIHIKDIVLNETSLKSGNKNLKKLVKKPLELNHTELSQKALVKMKNEKSKFAIVKDDSETIIGIITIGDIVEEIIGKQNEE